MHKCLNGKECTNKSDTNVDDFVTYDSEKINWSRDLKAKLRVGRIAEHNEHKVRTCLYRPFTKRNIFFDRMLNDVVYMFPSIFPTPETETENRVICANIGNQKVFSCLITGCIPEHVLIGGSQYFPFYVYAEDGSNRRENITDWGLTQFQEHCRDEANQQVGRFPLYSMPSCIILCIASSIR